MQSLQERIDQHNLWFAKHHIVAPEPKPAPQKEPDSAPKLCKPRLKHTFRCGLTTEEYEILAWAQGLQCAVCGEEPDKALCVDHNHKTGKVRELLCNGCNSALGFARENPEILRKLADYLLKHA